LAIINAPERILPRGKFPYKVGQGYGGPESMGNYIPGPTKQERSEAHKRLLERNGGELPTRVDPTPFTNIP
jgi:hypothetical protein